jgi:hypothetical protein
MMKCRCRGWLLGTIALGATAAAAPAKADPPEAEVRATATALFDEARRLMAAGRVAEACPKLEESLRLSPGIGVLYNLGDCYEKTGRTAAAWRSFRDAAAQANAAEQAKRAAAAQERVRSLEPRLSRLAIEVPSPAPDIRVTRDGVDAGLHVWGIEVPVDPGEHRVQATAPGFAPWEQRVRVGEEKDVVRVVVPPLERLQVASRELPAATAAPADLAPPPGRVEAKPGPFSGKALGIAGSIAGGLGMGAGVVLGLLAKSRADRADCDARDLCTDAGVAQRADARALGNLGTGIFIAGAAVAATGVALWVALGPSKRPPVALGLGTNGVSVAGRF